LSRGARTRFAATSGEVDRASRKVTSAAGEITVQVLRHANIEMAAENALRCGEGQPTFAILFDHQSDCLLCISQCFVGRRAAGEDRREIRHANVEAALFVGYDVNLVGRRHFCR